MRKVTVFNFITINGYYKGAKDDVSWHKHRVEESDFALEMLKHGNTLLFGRITYEMMAGFWPTPEAIKNAPEMAKRMNDANKIVFSSTLKKATWKNTKLINGNMTEELLKMKQLPGRDMTLLGSGSVLTQLADEGLIDEYQIMIDPIAITKGTAIFKNLKHELDLQLINTRTFKSGAVLLSYKPLNHI